MIVKRRAVPVSVTVVLTYLLLAGCAQSIGPAPTQDPRAHTQTTDPTRVASSLAAPTAAPTTTAAPFPTAKPTPTAVSLTSASSEEAVWTDVLRSVRDVSPILRPRSIPQGMDAVRMGQVGQGIFWVDYSGPGKRLGFGAGTFNPPIVTTESGGEQRSVAVRGQKGVLQFKSRVQPSESVQLWWEEPGRWIMGPADPPRNYVFYMVGASGVDPDVVLQFANSLGKVGQDTQEQARMALATQDPWTQIRTVLPASVPVYKPNFLPGAFGPAMLDEVANYGSFPSYTVVYQSEDDLIAFVLGNAKGAIGSYSLPDSTEPIKVNGVLGWLSTLEAESKGGRSTYIVGWRENELDYQIKVFSNRITKVELKKVVEALVLVK